MREFSSGPLSSLGDSPGKGRHYDYGSANCWPRLLSSCAESRDLRLSDGFPDFAQNEDRVPISPGKAMHCDFTNRNRHGLCFWSPSMGVR
jgi:hypothetical protein